MTTMPQILLARNYMDYKNFGELLKSIRKEKGWSQEEACKGVCDRRTYIRWEKGVSEPTDYYLHLLSFHFNYDLQAYYKVFICNESMRAYTAKKKAENLIERADWKQLSIYIKELKTYPEFQTGENKENLIYYNILYYYEFEKDYSTAIKYCVDGLRIENNAITLENPTDKIYSNIGICILNCLAICLNKISKIYQSNQIYMGIMKNIEHKIIPEITYYQSTEFEKKIYQVAAYNLGLNYKRINDIELALLYINKGIDFSIKHHYLNFLADLLRIKFKLLYAKKHYKESKLVFNECINLYLLQNKFDEYNNCKEALENEYPNIL